MPLRRQTQVIAQMDVMAAKTMRGAASGYHREMIAPLLFAMEHAKTPKQFQRNLRRAIKKMRTDALEKAAMQVGVQAAMIGQVTAAPRPDR